jgi:3'(2'), 5'-bisphosphate nucleotidase
MKKELDCYWLVDLVDGTKEFVKKNGESTVNFAFIENGMPVLGVVYVPALDETYWSKNGEGAFKDGVQLPLRPAEERQRYKIVASRSHMSDDTKAYIEAIKNG